MYRSVKIIVEGILSSNNIMALDEHLHDVKLETNHVATQFAQEHRIFCRIGIEKSRTF